MSKNLGIKITADSKNAEKSIDSVTSKINKLSKNLAQNPITKLSGSIGQLGKGFGVVKTAVVAVARAIGELSEKYEKQRQAEISLEQAVKNNPLLLGQTSVNLKKFASELQSLTNVGDEELLPFMANLANYGRSEAEIMDIMTTAVNMQASGVMDLGSAVTALNATYQGTAGTLGRQCSAIKNLTAEQLKNGEAVALLKKQYDGVAETVADEIGGAAKLKNTWGDFKEMLGGVIEPIKNGLAGIGNAILTPFTSIYSAAKNAAEEAKVTAEQMEKIDNIIKGFEKPAAEEAKTLNQSYAQEASVLEKNTDILVENLKILKKTEKGSEEFKKANSKVIDVLFDVDHALEEAGDPILDLGANWTESADEVDRAIDFYTQKLQKVRAKQIKLNQKTTGLIGNAKSDEAKAFKDQYNEEIKKTQEAINLRRRAGEVISKEKEEQELLNAGQKFYIKAVQEGHASHKKIEEDLQTRAKRVEELSKKEKENVDAVALAEKAYNEAVAKMQKEQKAHEAMGEVLTEEEKAREELSVKTKAYIALVSAGGGATETAKQALSDIKALGAKCAQYDVLKNTVSETEKAAEELIKTQKDALSVPLSETIEQTIALLDAEASHLDKNSELFKRYVEEKKKLQGYLSDVQGAEGREFSEGISLNRNSIEDAVESFKEISKLDIEYNRLSEEEKTKNTKLYTEKRRQLLMGSISQSFAATEEYLANFSEAMSLFAQIAEQTASAEAQVQQAELEKAYANNEITEEEYYREKEKIEKEAAEKSYKLQLAAWAMQLTQTVANVAMGVTNAFATAGNIYAGIAMAASVGALGAAQIATVAAQKPHKNFATGGIVGGDSYYGDKVQANVNSGEMILNRRQQTRLFDMINAGKGGTSGLNVSIKNYRANDTAVSTSFDSGTLKIVVDRIVNEGLSGGDYNNSLRTAQNLQNGKRYVN